MLIGVLSDTHGRLSLAAYEALADCERIIHAGDIGGPEILRELETLAPVTAVLGNNDFPEYGSHVSRRARVEVEGVKFLVAHYPRDVSVSALAPGELIPDVCIHGHTHVPRLDFGKEVRPAQYVICPGSVTRPRGGNPPSVAKIDVADGQVNSIRVESLTGESLLQV